MCHRASLLRPWISVGVGVALCLVGRVSLADEAPATPKRAVPSYDGREAEAAPVADHLLDVARFILAPPYIVEEYGVRRPLAVAVPAAEKIDLPTRVYDFFLFGPDHKAGIVPIGFVEFDFKPSVGFYAFWDDAGFNGNNLSLHVEAWPDDWFGTTATWRVNSGDHRTFQLRIAEIHRPDRLFYGVGPTTLESSESRYGIQRFETDVSYEWRLWRNSRIAATAGLRQVNTVNGHYDDDPGIVGAAASGLYPLPAGFGSTYGGEYDRVIVAVDTRVPAPRPGSGVRLELAGEQGTDVESAPMSGWLRYGVTAAGYLDLNGRKRVLSLAMTAQFADPLGAEPMPFTELVYLGGDHPMRGFYTGRLLGRSAAAATASYTWPIGPWFDGDLQVALGNVFNPHLDDLSARLLRFSAAFGVSVGGLQKTGVLGAQDAPLEFLIGIGSETFEQGGQIDSVRVMAGVPVGF
jgi:hypothetical protein